MLARPTKQAKEDNDADVKRRKPSAVTGLQIVEFLARNSMGARLGEVAAALDIDPGLTHRLITALTNDGWVMPTSDNGTYSLTARTIGLGATYIEGLDLTEHARPFMNELFQLTGESVFLGEARKDRVVCVARRLSDRTLTVWTEVGNSWPMEGSAVGNAILAARAARRGMKSDPSQPAAIQAALEWGYARDFGEYRAGVQSIAAPIYDASGEPIATISIGGPETRVGETEIKRLGPLVRDAAKGISQRLGCLHYVFPAEINLAATA
ncbi:MAG: IclR family transcriptional regulator [Mesorhizobium sp.]|nr:IclR family transcriptional regulator [Mesorhizobium sp.]